MLEFTWQRKCPNGYEVSSKGDSRFSAFRATLPDGRTIEQHYQCDIKGYDVGGTNWKLGKGKPPIHPHTEKELYFKYLSLWMVWAGNNLDLMRELYRGCREKNTSVLTDMFATTPVNQAHALSDILNILARN